jgi:hypothetical protein
MMHDVSEVVSASVFRERKRLIWCTHWINPTENRSIKGVHQIRRFPCLKMETQSASETAASLKKIHSLGKHPRCALIDKYIKKIHDWHSSKIDAYIILVSHTTATATRREFLAALLKDSVLQASKRTAGRQTCIRVADRNFFMDVSCTSKSNTKTNYSKSWSLKKGEAARLQSVLQTAKCCSTLLWTLPVADRRGGIRVS